MPILENNNYDKIQKLATSLSKKSIIRMRHGSRPVMSYSSGPVTIFAESSLPAVCSNLPAIVALIGGLFKPFLECLLLSLIKKCGAASNNCTVQYASNVARNSAMVLRATILERG